MFNKCSAGAKMDGEIASWTACIKCNNIKISAKEMAVRSYIALSKSPDDVSYQVNYVLSHT